jgi:hypothetical protein
MIMIFLSGIAGRFSASIAAPACRYRRHELIQLARKTPLTKLTLVKEGIFSDWLARVFHLPLEQGKHLQPFCAQGSIHFSTCIPGHNILAYRPDQSGT